MKKLFSLLLSFALIATVATPVWADITSCNFSVYTNVPGVSDSNQLLLYELTTSGNGSPNITSFKFPVDVPVTFKFKATATNPSDCSREFGNYLHAGDFLLNKRKELSKQNLTSCSFEKDMTLSLNDLEFDIFENPDQLYFYLKDKCNITFYLDKSNNYETHRRGYLEKGQSCYYPQTCTTSSGASGVQMCLGTVAPLVNKVLTPSDYAVAASNYPSLAAKNPQSYFGCTGTIAGKHVIYLSSGSLCNTCSSDCSVYCLNGCSASDQSCQELQALRNAGISSCGNKICEAGELQQGSAEYCLSDCSVEASGAFGETTDYQICDQIPDDPKSGSALREKCYECMGKTSGSADASESTVGIWTAVGCIKTSPGSITRTLVLIGLSISGGIALLRIILAAFLLTVSQGDPKRTSQAREMLTTTIIGLLFVIFSVTILEFIGIDILQIPGFGTLGI